MRQGHKMRDYLTFESECERLKQYFLLESSDDDLAEATNGDGKDESGEPGKETDGDAEKDSGDDDKSGQEQDTSDLDGDSDLGEITGNPGDAPSADKVNAGEGAPGAINPKNLLRELAEGEDNVYTRVIGAMKERFPGGKCVVKDLIGPLEQAVAHAVKAFMKNKNYAPLPKQAMKAVCDNIANTILHKCTGGDKKPERKPVQPAANEAVYYVKQAPVFEAEAIMEGTMKNIALATALGLGGANAATAESAPYATKSPTPLFQKQQQEANLKAERKQAVSGTAKEKSNTVQKQGSSGVPNAKDPASVKFSDGTTYQLTPDDYVTYKMANNLPAHYVVSGGSDEPKKTAEPKSGQENRKGSAQVQQKQGKGSATQAAVKADAKSGVGNGKKAGGGDNGKCSAPEPKESEGIGHTLHRLAHQAVDKGGEIASGLVGGVVGAVKGGYKGANQGYRTAKANIEKDHDRMIKERKK